MAPQQPVVLITGATGSVGHAVVRAFAGSDCRIGLVGTNLDRLVALAADVELANDRWAAGVGDLGEPAEAIAAVDAVVERFGPIDVLLHLVGGYAGGASIVDLDPADVAAMLDQHLWSTLNVVRAVVPGMTERGWGRIVAVTASITANPPPRMAPYAIAKAAEETLLRTLAREVASSGVTVNILAARQVDAKHERETDPSPKNAPWTTPEEIAATMRFLVSDAAAAINGARIPMDGRA